MKGSREGAQGPGGTQNTGGGLRAQIGALRCPEGLDSTLMKGGPKSVKTRTKFVKRLITQRL
jgi:hypothetical protein